MFEIFSFTLWKLLLFLFSYSFKCPYYLPYPLPVLHFLTKCRIHLNMFSTYHLQITQTSILFSLGNSLKYLIKSYIFLVGSISNTTLFSGSVIIQLYFSFPQMYIYELTKGWNILNYLHSVVMNTI